jgi:phenylacetate-coenzyme A ligase PaaK-like adenylate-forming protein
MSPSLPADLVSAVGRRYPRVPLALLRRTPLAVVHALRRAGLRTTFRQALRSPFYRDAFARAGIDLGRARGPGDLGDFFLTSDVLKTAPERLLCGTPDLAIESSGTSGRITRVYLSRAELEYNARQGALLNSVYGLGPGDRLLCTLDLAWGLGSLIMERGVRHARLFAMVVGRVDPVAAYERLGEYRFNVVVSDPFWLARLTEIARERGRPHRLKYLMGGGEGITERTRRELMRFWEAPLCMTYASTEAGTVLAFECPHLTGYHVNEFDFPLPHR